MNMQTPLSRVRGLGSAREGSDHFWWQRMTAIANIVLVCFFLISLIAYAGQDYEAVRAYLASPIVSIVMLLLILSVVYHMRLGMQVIIEDYVHSEGRKIAFLMLNTFFAIFIGLTCIFAILKLSFGA